MSESLKNRSAAIRDYLAKIEPPVDRTLAYKYSVVAARWEAVRLMIDRGNATPADDHRFRELSHVLGALAKQIGLSGCSEDDKGVNDFPGITFNGFLPGDPSRIIDKTWQEAAEGW